MTGRQVEAFFRALSRRHLEPAAILLFGGGAAIVQTQARATLDLDLELQPVGRGVREREALAHLLASIQQTQEALGMKVQAGENIQRWSMINWADYRDHQRRWKKFGSISVYLLEPEYFALTKLSRASETDVQDIIGVFKARGGSWKKLAAVCGRALRESPLSTAQDGFRRQVEHFLRSDARGIWGPSYSPDEALTRFQRAYQRKTRSVRK